MTEAAADTVPCRLCTRLVARDAAVCPCCGVKEPIRYVHMEVGHAAQNVWLQATALGLGTVVVGAFGPAKRILGLARDELSLCLMSVGRASSP